MVCFLVADLGIMDGMSQFIRDTVYYESGQVKAFGKTKEARRLGDWQVFYPDGTLNAELRYDPPGLDGEQRYYDFEGNLIAIENWSADQLQDSAVYFYSNGEVEKTGRYENALYEGTWKFFFENGQLKRMGTYQEGLPHGEWVFYHEDGTLFQEGFFEEGVESGLWRFYDDKGRPTYEGHYKNGERTGQWYFFKKSGKRKKWKRFD